MQNKTHAAWMEQWGQTVGAAMALMTKTAETTGQAMDRITTQQIDAARTCALSSTRQLGAAWASFNTPLFTRRTTRHIALVTGGTGGIGTEVCKKLAQAGHHVVATHLPAEKGQARKWQARRLCDGLRIDITECDVTDFDRCAKMVASVEQKWGALDILVNCAGVTRDTTLRKMQQDDWNAVLNTNLDSVFNVTKNVVGGMIDRGYGRIINISSVNAQKGQFGQTNYSAAKAGMDGFTKALARELANHGITVNTVSPGYVATTW